MLRAIARLVASNGIGQVILAASMVLFARVYEPAQFGVYGAMIAFGSMFAVVAMLQMNLASVLPPDDRSAVDLLRVGIVATCCCALIGTGLVLVVGEAIWGTPHLPVTAACLGWAVANSLARLYQGWFTRKGEFAAVSLWAIIRAVTIVAAQAALGLGHVAGGLVQGALVGELVALGYLVSSRHTPAVVAVCRMRGLRLWRRLREYRDFALIGTVQELVSVAAFSMPLFIVNGAYTTAVGGQFAMAQRLVWAPVAMVGASIGQVVYHRLAGADRRDLRRSPALGIGRPMALALLAGLVAAAAVPHLLPWCLGERWALAGRMAGYLVIWGLAFLAVVPYRMCYRVLRMQHLQLLIDLGVLVALLALLLAARTVAPMALVRLLVVLGLLQNLALAGAMRHALRETPSREMGRPAVFAARAVTEGKS